MTDPGPRAGGSPLRLRIRRAINGLRWLRHLLWGRERTLRRRDALRAFLAFDGAFYLSRNPDVAAAGVFPFEHYCRIGWQEGRDPSPSFSTHYYLARHQDVGASGINPFVHYVVHGRAERRPGQPPAPLQTPKPKQVPKQVPVPAARPRRPAPPPPLPSAADPFDPAAAQAWTQTLRADPAFARVCRDPPLVSIVLPTRNRAATLPLAVESVRAQSHANWELLLVDDGSEDETPAYLDQLRGDPRIRLLSSGGAGVSEARNCGLRAARGGIIAYLDSDNRWTPDYLLLSLAELERSGAACVYSVLELHDGSGAPPWYRARAFDYASLTYANFIDINVFLHRRALFEELGGFDPALQRMVDWDLILRYTRAGSVRFANFVGALYDNSPRPDRITHRHGASWQNVVRNRHMLDWPALQAALPARDPARASVIICVYGQKALTEACLAALTTQHAGAAFEIVLVDNGSDEETARHLQDWADREARITLLRNRENLNFALGNNLGFALSRGGKVVFLNNDTEVGPEWLGTLLQPLEDPAVKGAQPKLLFPDGRIQSIGNVFSRHAALAYPLYAGQPGSFLPSQSPRALKAVTAACLALRAEDFVALSGFDPLFTNGQEDTDLCLRLGRGEAVFRYVPDALVWHHEGRTPGRATRIRENRALFLARWRNRPEVAADDHLHYARDGVAALDYRPDGQAQPDGGEAIWTPARLVPAAEDAAPPAPVMLARERIVAIKIACPRYAARERWGDYHFAVALAGAFMRQGVRARVDCLEDWSSAATPGDINLVLRGLSRFGPVPDRLNLLWVISHPDKTSAAELRAFDHLFVASRTWPERLAAEGIASETLLQCTDAGRFLPGPAEPALRSPALYVANSRRIYRRCLADALAQGLTLDIYGEMWEGLAPPAWVKAENLPNRALARHYRSAGAVLNDHWDDMRANGFVSNRLFDVLACAAPLITDRVEGIPEALLPACTFFGEERTLAEALALVEATRAETQAQRLAIAGIVRREHSFDARAARILEVITEKLSPAPASGA